MQASEALAFVLYNLDAVLLKLDLKLRTCQRVAAGGTAVRLTGTTLQRTDRLKMVITTDG